MIRAALDYSGDEIAFAVVDPNGRILSEARKKVSGRNSAILPALVQNALAEAGLDFSDVKAWTVGVGPGSFTALRVAAAFVLGIVQGTGIPVRGIPSACGMCSGMTAQSVLALYDGRKGELLAFGLRRRDGFYVPDGFQGVLADPIELKRQNRDAFVVRPCDRAAVRSFAPDCECVESPGVDPSVLARLPEGLCDCSPTEPIYLRPAVFVDPKPIRSFGA